MLSDAGKTAFAHQQRCLCLEQRCALPCNKDAPCMCTVCCLQLFREEKLKFLPAIDPKCMPRIDGVNVGAPSVPAINRS